MSIGMLHQELHTQIEHFIQDFKHRLIDRVGGLPGQTHITGALIYKCAADVMAQLSNQQHESDQLLSIVRRTQETVIDQQQQIQRLKQKVCVEDQLNHSFFNLLMKDARKNQEYSQTHCLNARLHNYSHATIASHTPVNGTNLTSITHTGTFTSTTHTRTLNEGADLHQPTDPKQDESGCSSSQLSRCQIPNLNLPQNLRKEEKICVTDRSQACTCRSSMDQPEFDEKQKKKALARLLKLQKFVYEKQNSGRRGKGGRNIWNYELEANLDYIKQQNNSLKAIQSNLITHLSLLEKFRDVPTLEVLEAREEASRKKEKFLTELSDTLFKKQYQLNKKHSQFLKLRKSRKVL